jgi:outer membrane protein assembly factor BamB
MRDAAEILGRTKLGIRVSLAPVLAGRFVVIVDNAGRIQAFDRAGRKKWTHDPKSLSASRPAGDDKFVYAATAKGKILKLKAASGRLVRSGDVGERVTSPLVLFADGQKRERLLAGTLSGRLVCLDAERLAAVWTSEAAKDMIQSRPLVVGGKVVYGSWDARLHAVEAGTGRALWSWTENDNIYYAPAGCGPVSDGSRVFVCSPDGNVSAVDLATGKTVWREKYSAWESLGISADRTKLFIKSRTDEFNLVDAAEGRLLRRTAPAHGNGDTMPVSPVEEKDKIYYGALDGRVYEIDRAGGIKTILDLGPAGVQTLLPLGEGRFAAVNLDGTLVVFRISS